MTIPGETIATFEHSPSGVRHHLKATILGGMYRQYDNSYAGDNVPYHMRWDQDDINVGEMRVIKSPHGNLYHVWHVCMCAECEPIGGRTFDHSQASFNDHLRNTPNDLLFTFPCAKENK
jgi:hypothetical protein